VRKHLDRSNLARTGSVTALLLSFFCTSALASNSVKLPCKDASNDLSTPDFPALALNVKHIDHGLIDAAADMKLSPAVPAKEKLPSSALAEIKSSPDSNDVEDTIENDESPAAVSGSPETALRLPGVAEKDQPRFRRQMNRTDI
jgi:hypothetical protein